MQRNPAGLVAHEFDVLIIGAGAFGAAAARDAALRGLRTALIERADFGGATSAECFKMVHGGIRYLQHADVPRLRASCYERSALLRIAPHLVHPLPIAIPTYGHGRRGRVFLAAGATAYDLLTLDRNSGIRDQQRQIRRSRFLSRTRLLELFPHLRTPDLSGAVVFEDGQMHNPARLVLALVNSIPNVGRAYSTEWPYGTFEVAVAFSFAIGGIAFLCLAGFGFVLFSGARPGWRAALRRSGSLADALARAVVAAAGTAGLARWAALASSRFPALFEPDPTLPRALERLSPGYAGFWSAATATFGLAVAAAAAALAWSQPTFQKRGARILAFAAILLALTPIGTRSSGEFAAAFLPELVMAAWLAFCVFGLLKDDAAAWVLFGALYFGGSRAIELLAQPATPDRAAGWTVAVLVILASVALLAGRREPRSLGTPELSAELPQLDR